MKIWRFHKAESGQGLILVIVLLWLCAIIMIPISILFFMQTGLDATQMHERRLDELYAADAGVNNALWQLQYGELGLKSGEWLEQLPELTINGKAVNVTVEALPLDVAYLVTSTAGNEKSSTTVEAYVEPFSLFDNAITSLTDLTIHNGNTEIFGDVQYDGEAKVNIDGAIYGERIDNVDAVKRVWPTPEQLSQFYNVDLLPLDEQTINLKDWDDPIGPWYVDGSLTIKNTGGSSDSIELAGTVYVTGDVTVQKDCQVILNGQTIYAEGAIRFNPDSSIIGSGCIVAVGEVDFQPQIPSGQGSFLFVMSVEGEAKLRPGDTFYGSVAGSTVNVQPGCTVNRIDAGSPLDLNFPWKRKLRVLTYTILQGK